MQGGNIVGQCGGHIGVREALLRGVAAVEGEVVAAFAVGNDEGEGGRFVAARQPAHIDAVARQVCV